MPFRYCVVGAKSSKNYDKSNVKLVKSSRGPYVKQSVPHHFPVYRSSSQSSLQSKQLLLLCSTPCSRTIQQCARLNLLPTSLAVSAFHTCKYPVTFKSSFTNRYQNHYVPHPPPPTDNDRHPLLPLTSLSYCQLRLTHRQPHG